MGRMGCVRQDEGNGECGVESGGVSRMFSLLSCGDKTLQKCLIRGYVKWFEGCLSHGRIRAICRLRSFEIRKEKESVSL